MFWISIVRDRKIRRNRFVTLCSLSLAHFGGINLLPYRARTAPLVRYSGGILKF
jgi:hypothetical protein